MDLSKHLRIFNPADRDLMYHVVGCGSVGSKVAIALARLGCKRLTLWDFDQVEERNIPNQAFFPPQTGEPKVEALRKLLEGINPQISTTLEAKGFLSTQHDLSSSGNYVVFACVDSMRVRKEIFEQARKHLACRVLVEGRQGISDGRVYTLKPIDADQAELYAETLYSDELVKQTGEQDACGFMPSVGVTSDFTSSLMVSQFINWHRGKQPAHEVIYNLTPLGLYHRTWGEDYE